MPRPVPLFLILAILFSTTNSYAQEANDPAAVMQTVDAMNAAWKDQDVETCVSFFTDDIDFENSFGWTIRERGSMARFLEWLFKRYPNDADGGPIVLESSSTVQNLASGVALVEALQVMSTGEEEAARSIRSSYILKRQDGNWLIWKMRTWEQQSSDAAPKDIVAVGRFAQP